MTFLAPYKIFQSPTGAINGRKDNGVIKATGIPYAKAGRFEKPVPIQKYASPVGGNQLSPACPQKSDPLYQLMYSVDLLQPIGQSEDCLKLSITRPDNDREELPVMVWIHGGSYTSGAGDAAIFDPSLLVREQNVLVVNVNYRLGLFGFLGGYNDIPPNLGYQDIVEALKWVNKNIQAFGGDPGNVTLFGQSAGGDAIAHMLLIEETKGLFHNVIIQSAPLGLIFGKQKMNEAMIAVAKQIPKGASISTVLTKQEKVLGAAKAYGLNAAMPLGNQYGCYPFPEESKVKEVWRERAAAVNLFIGYTEKETSFFIPLIPKFKKIAALPIIGKLLAPILVNITTQKVYKKGAKMLAETFAKSKGNVYLYQIDWGSTTNGMGATHTIDFPLLFGDPLFWEGTKLVADIPAQKITQDGQKVRALWARFAWTGTLDKKGKIQGVLTYAKK